ncbi:PLP-dependent aminotransferase family protein [Mesorhizobium loti]|uniref:PLP-dependent aminotransferase family protein n=1 Tax=Mesorhizobium jarvisii TaxID=1777867 RepID=A0A6M7TFN9_9HYPH|nr:MULTISPECIES: PLP-dependent aminotransferase family protein [Mesorhizobium]OBQ58731.1 GntR family transcriptional regulator [Mesorhizobium loti]QKC63731.1 PLP-dependent aminotransferase family protein [Mesorhizobium jarvisii]QKD09643.1 PLP-dependent aminotransferase family protein [Mesorhizobium loti]RJT28334.1 PLP-dependent aminotransferase family protein [Mesorhizobium jarvisii]
MLSDLRLTEDESPVYRRLADAIAERIAAGTLAVGDRLPPQRDIARALGINVTTVTRALATLQQRGLLEARPGRGTTVAARQAGERPGFVSAPSDESGIIDLSVNRPATSAYLDALAALLPRLSRDPHYASLQDYHPPEGPLWARAAIADWLKAVAGDGDPGRVVLAAGAQHGLDCLLGAVTRQGEVVLADEVTYQGINALCRVHGLDLRGVAMDRGGMRPDAFDAACAQLRPRAVFLVPTLHNPTTITLSEARRHELAAVARRHNVLIIEDDVYRPLADEALPSFASLEPELTVHIGALSKCLAPGLRLGFVIAPRAIAGQVAAALRINCWSISPLTALIGARMIEDGAAARVIEVQKQELRQRQAILSEILGRYDVQSQPSATHAWLRLPEPWRGAGFARTCLERGVALLPGDAFAVGREPVQHGVRINVGAARSQDDLRTALTTMAELLSAGHLQLPGFV